MLLKAILKLVLVMVMSLVMQTPTLAEEKKVDTEVKELSGISIIGNK